MPDERTSTTPENRREVPVKGHPGIYKRGSRYVVTWRDNGKLKRSSHRTLTEAKGEKGRRNAGQTQAFSREPFDVYARRWIETTQGQTARGMSDNTRDAYRDILERVAIPFFRKRRIGDIRTTDVKAYITHLKTLDAKQGKRREQGQSDRAKRARRNAKTDDTRAAETKSPRKLKGSTIRRYLAPVKAMFSEAVADGHMADNPAKKVRVIVPGERKNPQPKTLTKEELRALLDEVPDDHRLFVDFLFLTSCRISEAINAKWSDLGLDEQGRPVFNIQAGKTEASADAVVLQADLSRRLTVLRSTTDFAADGDPIFTTLTGEPLNDHNFRREVFRPAARRAGVKATPHQLRHTSLSMFYEVQRDQEKTRKRARHADSTTTFKFYVRAVESPDADFLEDVLYTADDERQEDAASG